MGAIITIVLKQSFYVSFKKLQYSTFINQQSKILIIQAQFFRAPPSLMFIFIYIQIKQQSQISSYT